MNNFYHRTWAEIDLDILSKNIEIIRRKAKNKEIIAVVKANAYGHGDAAVAKELNKRGIKIFAVSNLWEAQRLHEEKIDGKKLIFGYCDIPLITENLDKDFIFTVGSVEYAEYLSQAAEKSGEIIPVHIKIDTGMSRVGISSEPELDKILSLKGLDAGACYTHFAVSDSLDEKDIEFTNAQQEKISGMCRSRGLKFHTQNSGGIIYHDEFDGDYVRAGIVMYGQKPDARFDIPDGIRPVFSLKSVISQIKTVSPGCTVSYGRTFEARRETRLALIPCGYADGFNRRLSGQWNVLINGSPAPVCGRICMDQTLVDITDINAEIGDEVTVYSGELCGGSSITRAAELIGTINYELLCAVGTRVPRIYIRNGSPSEMKRYL